MAKIWGDRWRNEGQIDEGGQGRTFRVSDLQGDETGFYVLKELKNTKRLQRFRMEIDALTRIDHPNVLRIVDAQLDAKPFLVSEYCAAGSLERIWNIGAIDDELLFRLFLQVCEGVGAAHSVGVIHRDIKPANILMRRPEGPAVVADFGICYMETAARLTTTSEVMGARYFMAPELADGRVGALSETCDVYSLGKLLYWLLSHGQIFDRERHRTPRYDLVLLRSTSLLEHANRLLDRLLAEEPSKRLSSVVAVAREADKLRYLLRGGYNVPSNDVRQRCRYCGVGTYRAEPETILTRIVPIPGMQNQPHRKTLVCDNCGNVQQFVLDRLPRERRAEW